MKCSEEIARVAVRLQSVELLNKHDDDVTGGLTAVIWTDFIQTIIMLIGAIYLMIVSELLPILLMFTSIAY